MTLRPGAVLIAVLALVSSPAMAGVIRGTLRLPAAAMAMPSTANPYPGRAGSMPMASEHARGLPEDAVVYVDHVPPDAESALWAAGSATPRLAQKGQCFVPRVLAIAVGTRVDFPNLDPIYHNVFSLSPTRRFDLGKYPRGTSRQVVFPKPGLVNVYCDIHSNMEAFILVLPHHGFTRPSASGEYALPDLPAGHYVLKIWHPDLGERTEPVDVPATGDVAADVSF